MTIGREPPRRLIGQIQEARRMLAEGASFADVAKKLGVKYKTLYARLARYDPRETTARARIAQLERENEILRSTLAMLDASTHPQLLEVLTSAPRAKRKSRSPRSKE